MFSRVPATAVLTGAAGLIHAAAAVTHVGETVLLGLLFALTGWAQMITAVWLAASHSRAALWVMTATNVAALAGWAVSRTVGLPVLHPGVEPAGTADVLTVVLEALAVVAAVVLLVRGRRSEHPARRALPVGLATAGLFALGASGAAVVALGSGGGHGHDEEIAAAEAGSHGHEDGATPDEHGSTEQSTEMGSRQPGTLPAALHRHRPGIYHLHENIDLHHHSDGIVHVHTKTKSEPSPSAEPDSTGDHHDDGTDGHAH